MPCYGSENSRRGWIVNLRAREVIGAVEPARQQNCPVVQQRDCSPVLTLFVLPVTLKLPVGGLKNSALVRLVLLNNL
jgi:hypothetical protein